MSANTEDNRLISYLTLRKAIGILGFLWPFLLALPAMFFEPGLKSSISEYYYTPLRGVFVGTLWAIGFFLFSYNGYDVEDARLLKDRVLSRVAWGAALGVSLFPAHKDATDRGIVGYLHFLFAAVLFLILTYFCFKLFVRDGGKSSTTLKLKRNKWYRRAGSIMLACIALIAIYYRLPASITDSIAPYKPVFWLESIAIVTFGASWLIKGQLVLADPPEEREKELKAMAKAAGR